jgi:hypothetical protein
MTARYLGNRRIGGGTLAYLEVYSFYMSYTAMPILLQHDS